MAGSYDLGSESDDNFQYERQHIKPTYDAFICPLSKQIMKDPVTLENGQTFQREAIEKWFNECKENGRKLVCPLTLRELKTTDMNPSIALRNTIEEWNARNEAVQLDFTRKSLTSSSETDVLQALRFIQQLATKNVSNKHIIRNAELIPMIVDMLKNTSHKVRFRALEALRIVVEDDNDNKVI
ncbi:putative U box domain, armadillo-like helical, Zinc finger, RING/FYVE/PHD-type [Helianthus anomalus]